MEMLVDCSIFTLGAKVLLIENGEVVETVNSVPMTAEAVGHILAECKADHVYIKGAKGFTNRLSKELITDFKKKNVKITCIL